MRHEVPNAIASDIGEVLSELAFLGYVPVGSRYSPESFGNYYVDLASPDGALRIVRDRLQYSVETQAIDQLKRAGMFRAFDDRETFQSALLSFLRAHK
jgi:hypothetical protein